MPTSLADQMREHINTCIDENTFDYKVKSDRIKSQETFFSNNPEANQKSIKSIHQRILREVWTSRGYEKTEVENTPKTHATKNQFDPKMNETPMNANPKEQDMITAQTPQTSPLDTTDNTRIVHTPESVGSFFQAAWSVLQIPVQDLPELSAEKELRLGNIYKPIFDQYFATQGKLNVLMTIFMTVGTVAPEINEARKIRAKRLKAEKLSSDNKETKTQEQIKADETIQKAGAQTPDEMVPRD